MIKTFVVNNFTTGVVDIELEEYQVKDGKEVKWQDNPVVLPGTNVSKIPRIHNNGNDCYVRVKLNFRETQEKLEDYLYGIEDTWVKSADGYYYYKKILKTGEDLDIFKGLKIPDDFSQEEENSKFYLDIDVDAIQSKNFNQDLTSYSPWGNVEILDCHKEGQYDINTFKKADSKSFIIEYQGETVNKLVVNEDDFFLNLPVLMPGDNYEDSIDLVNKSNNDIDLYFKSEITDNSELLDKIYLSITVEFNEDKRTVYEGTLKAEKLKEYILLGTIPGNTKEKLYFKIIVPAELDNKFSIAESNVKWILATDIQNKTETVPVTTFKTPSVRTGDSNTVGILLIISGVIMGIISLFIKKKSKTDGKEEGGKIHV